MANRLASLAGPQRERYSKARGLTPEERAYFERKADEYGCRDALRCLDPVADAVLAHKPKPKSKPARKRARRAKKIAQAADA
jgi:hypothetical protein